MPSHITKNWAFLLQILSCKIEGFYYNKDRSHIVWGGTLRRNTLNIKPKNPLAGKLPRLDQRVFVLQELDW